ncbi:MAG TPA: hypothetical protein DGR79_04370, partial [Clostridiales bacterium]|nr:hypothetical protein [Clostridiales bacterium]
DLNERSRLEERIREILTAAAPRAREGRAGGRPDRPAAEPSARRTARTAPARGPERKKTQK